jgi:uncharacterized peroxidase-related enzyme
MQRINAVNPAQATGKTKQLLDAVQAKLGVTPNLMRTLASSPSALEAYLNFGAALAGGLLSAQFREQIALTVAEANSCDYCLAAHTTIGKMVKLNEHEIISARLAEANDIKTDAALKFVRQVVLDRGEISDSAFGAVRDAGFSEGEITEIIANIALNIFTNYFNHIARTDVDFPKVQPVAEAAVA